MNDKLQNVLVELAEKLGTTVEKLWPELVKFRVGMLASEFSIMLVVTVVSVLVGRATFRHADWSEGPNNVPAFAFMACFAGAVIGAVNSLMCLHALIGALISPQASTVLWLLHRVSGR